MTRNGMTFVRSNSTSANVSSRCRQRLESVWQNSWQTPVLPFHLNHCLRPLAARQSTRAGKEANTAARIAVRATVAVVDRSFQSEGSRRGLYRSAIGAA